MILHISAAICLFISLFTGLVIQDAANPWMMLPFALLSSWLVMTGSLLKLRLNDPVLLGLTALWAVWTMSAAHSAVPFNSKVTLIVMSTLPLSYIVWRCAAFSTRALLKMAGIVLLSGIVFSAIGIMQVTDILPNPRWEWRAYYPFLDPNLLGVFLSMIILPLVTATLSREIARPVRICLVVALLILTSGLIATQSRSAFLSTGVGLIMILLLQRNHIAWTKKSLGLLAALLASSAGFLVYTKFFERFVLLFQSGGDKDFMSRLYLWKTSLEMSIVHPLIGYGFGTFNTYYPQVREPDFDNSAGWWVHMDPLQWAVESGWSAPLIFYAICAYIVWSVWRKARDGELHVLQAGAAAALGSLFLNAHSAYPLHVVPFMIMATGMIAAIVHNPGPASSRKITLAGAIPLLTTFLLFWAILIQLVGTLYYWQSVNTARASGNASLYWQKLDLCLKRGDPEFAYCRLILLESLFAGNIQGTEETLQLIQESRRGNNMLPHPDYFLGLYHLQRNDFKEAEKYLSIALEKDPLYWIGRKALIETLERDGSYDAALSTLLLGQRYPYPKSDIPYINQKEKDLRDKIEAAR